MNSVQKTQDFTNGLGWIRDVERVGDVAHHIGVVHGTLAGYGRDDGDRYYPMTQRELDSCALDLWLLGHIHVPFPRASGIGERVFYAGVLEPESKLGRYGYVYRIWSTFFPHPGYRQRWVGGEAAYRLLSRCAN